MDETKMMACSDKAYNEFEETVPLMLSEDYSARFVAEYRQTKIRYERLKAYCNRIEAAMRNPEKVDMPPHDCDLDLLREQQKAMGLYLHVLEIRAESSTSSSDARHSPPFGEGKAYLYNIKGAGSAGQARRRFDSVALDYG
jgi:hypothetical protein